MILYNLQGGKRLSYETLSNVTYAFGTRGKLDSLQLSMHEWFAHSHLHVSKHQGGENLASWGGGVVCGGTMWRFRHDLFGKLFCI